jgi:ribosomal protein S18 acetylase RimI-like enzyme
MAAATIIPLAESNRAALGDLLDEQCREWLQLFRWNYSEPSQIIRNAIARHILPGFVALAGSRPIGFSYYLVGRSICSIGDLYVSKQWRGSGADRQIAASILEAIESDRRIRRIESQCMNIGNQGADELFESRGFARFERHYMIADLSQLQWHPTKKPPKISIRQWRHDDLQEAARIVHLSSEGQVDSKINSQYRTEGGCQELLSILIDSPWCGRFLERASRVAVSKETGRPVGLLLAAQIARHSGHISQISVLPQYQGIGIGRSLLTSALYCFQRLGFQTVSLTVTRSNLRAFNLYASCGFRTAHAFNAFSKEL